MHDFILRRARGVVCRTFVRFCNRVCLSGWMAASCRQMSVFWMKKAGNSGLSVFCSMLNAVNFNGTFRDLVIPGQL